MSSQNPFDWGRFQGSTRSYAPAPAFQPPAEDQGTTFSDYLKSFGAGAGSLASSVGWLAQQAGLEDIGGAIETIGTEATDFWLDSMSDSARRDAAKEFVVKNPETGWYEWGDANLDTVLLAAAGSLPGTAAGMGLGAGITKTLQVFANPMGRKVLQEAVAFAKQPGAGPAAIATATAAAKKLKLIDTVLGAGGFGVGEGVIGGAAAGQSVEEQVMRLPHDQLILNDRYRQVYESAEGMEELDRRAYAAKTVANEAGTTAGWQAGLTTSLLGAPMGAFFGPLLGGAKLSSTLPKALAAGAAGEAAQEFLQSGSERYISNVARQPFDSSVDSWDGVLNDAVGGALAGAMLGGSLAGSNVEPAKQELAQKRAAAAQTIGGELRIAGENAARAGADGVKLRAVVKRALDKEIDVPTAIAEINKLEKAAVEKAEKEAKAAAAPKPPPPGTPPTAPPPAGDTPGTAGAETGTTGVKTGTAGASPGTAAPKPTSEEQAKRDAEAKALNDRIRQEQQQTTTLRPTKAAVDPRSPADIEAARQRIAAAPGKKQQTSFAGQEPIETVFKLVELDDLQASHDRTGAVNPQYPSALQPRDRSRTASKQWLADKATHFRPELITEGVSLAEGAPEISPEGVVESGNGRTMILEELYKGGTNPAGIEAYKQHITKNADRFGISAEELASLKQPVLVRVRQQAMDEAGLVRLTQAANTTETAALSPVEQANVDAGNLTNDDLNLFAADDSGNVLAASNDAFVQSFVGRMSAAERGKVMTESGQPTKQLSDRIQAAIFAKAYNDDRMLGLMAEEANPDIKNIVTALTKAAPAFARARSSGELGELNIVDPLLDAVELLRAARAKDMVMSEYLAQQGLFGQTAPLTASLATFLDKNIRSSKRMGEALAQMGAFIEKEVDSKKNASLFGNEREVGLAEIVAAASRYMTEQYGDGAGIDLAGTPPKTTKSPAPAPVSEKQTPKQTAKPKPAPPEDEVVDELPELEPEQQSALDAELQANGIPIANMVEADKLWSEGYQIYAFHEMDEQPSRVESIEHLHSNVADRLLALPPKPLAEKPAAPAEADEDVEGDPELENLSWQQEAWDELSAKHGLEAVDKDQLYRDIKSSPWVRQELEEEPLAFTASLEAVIQSFAQGMGASQRIIGTDDHAYFHNRGYVHASKGEHEAELFKSRENIFPAPEQRVFAAKQVTETLSQDEARARLEEWKEEARRIGREEDHSNDVIISLFDHSGAWSQPWAEAGYDVRRFDIKDGDDILAGFPVSEIAAIHEAGKRVVGVLSACPCTSFAASGARWWESQHDAESKEMVEKKFGEWAAEYFDTPLEYSQTLVAAAQAVIEFTDPRFYALENPRGRIARVTGLPDPTLTFDPHHYGDPYTKETKLWGEFNPNLPLANVEPSEGSLIHKLRGDNAEDKARRSLTPEGFAYAFFMGQRSSATAPAPEPTQPALFSRSGPAPGQGDMFLNHPETIPSKKQAPAQPNRKSIDTMTAAEIEAELEQLERIRVQVNLRTIEDRVSPLFATTENRYQYGTEANDLRVRDLMTRAERLSRRERNIEREIPEQEGLALGADRPSQGRYEEMLAMLRKAGVAVDRHMTMTELTELADKHKRGMITDIGEKIGGARKDDAIKGRPKRKGAKDDVPGWRRQYVVLPETKRRRPLSLIEIGKGVEYETIKTPAGTHMMVRKGEEATGTYGIYLQTPGFGGSTNTKLIKGGFDTEEFAEFAIPFVHVARNHGVSLSKDGRWHIYRRVAKRKALTVRDGFGSRDEAMAYMASNAEDIISWRPATPERPHLENLERYGPERRQGDISPERFMAEFGFRGAEFGNWLPQDERQGVLNLAYDALMDMANTLQVPPRALSLNGELAIGFGSRGQGLGKAKAHYESDRVVINLTRIKGAGSLAHEWWHAFDHYLARQSGKTETPKGQRKSQARIKEDTYVSHGFDYRSRTRAELQAAVTALMKKIQRKQAEFDRDVDLLEKNENSMRERLVGDLEEVYSQLANEVTWRKRFNKPASAADLKLTRQIINDILAGKVGAASYVQGKGWKGRYTWEAFEKLSQVYKRNRGRTGFSEHDILTRAVSKYSSLERIQKQVAEGKANNKETRTVTTDYVSNARVLDRTRASDYWATPHELSARAFESWVYDSMRQAELRDDYLVHSVTNDLYPPKLNPYPEGDERRDIGMAFRELFDTIKAAAPDAQGNVALFSRAGQALRDVTITETAIVEETGELVEIESNAEVLLRQIDKRIENIEKLRECLRT